MMGENTLQKGGIFASFYGGKNSERPIRFTTTLEASHDKEVNESRGNSVSFFESGNIFGKSMSLNKSHNYNFNWNGMLSIPTSFAYINLDQYLTYASTSSNGTQQSVQGNQPLPNEWTNVVEGMVNDYTDLNHDKIHSLNYSAMLNATVKLPNDKELGVNFAANYNTATDNLILIPHIATSFACSARILR